MRKIISLAIFLLGAAVLISVPVVTEAGKTRPVVRTAIRSDTTAPLRQMPEIPLMPEVLGEIFEPGFPRWLIPIADNGSTMGIRTRNRLRAVTIGGGPFSIGLIWRWETRLRHDFAL